MTTSVRTQAERILNIGQVQRPAQCLQNPDGLSFAYLTLRKSKNPLSFGERVFDD